MWSRDRFQVYIYIIIDLYWLYIFSWLSLSLCLCLSVSVSLCLSRHSNLLTISSASSVRRELINTFMLVGRRWYAHVGVGARAQRLLIRPCMSSSAPLALLTLLGRFCDGKQVTKQLLFFGVPLPRFGQNIKQNFRVVPI